LTAVNVESVIRYL